MIKEIIELLDELVLLIKSKDESKQTFAIDSVRRFEFRFFINLNIARFELLQIGTITDRTADVLNKDFVFQTFEFYKYQYPDVYKMSSKLFSLLLTCNEKWGNNTLPSYGLIVMICGRTM